MLIAIIGLSYKAINYPTSSFVNIYLKNDLRRRKGFKTKRKGFKTKLFSSRVKIFDRTTYYNSKSKGKNGWSVHEIKRQTFDTFFKGINYSGDREFNKIESGVFLTTESQLRKDWHWSKLGRTDGSCDRLKVSIFVLIAIIGLCNRTISYDKLIRQYLF